MPIDEDNIKGLLSKWGLAAKPCDSCSSAAALLFCRPHSAFLCLSCDAAIHSSDHHARVWMCEVCEQAPAAVTCKADAAALCTSCDRDIHSANPLARRHHRLPVVPFLHTPPVPSPATASAVAVAVDDESWLIPNLQGHPAGADFMYSSSDVDSSFMDSGSLNFGVKNQVDDEMCNNRSSADSVVPNHTKTSSPLLNAFANENCFEIDFTQSKLSPTFNFSAHCISQSISSSDVGIVPDGNLNTMSEVSKGGNPNGVSTAAQPLSRMDREARVMRYREKRKNRKFEKTIRYASRKAYAEARPRIKGRFAKRNNADAELEQIYSSAVTGGFLVDDELYGVVPSF